MKSVALLFLAVGLFFSCCEEPEPKANVSIPAFVNPDQISGRNPLNQNFFNFEIPEIQGVLIQTSIVNGVQYPDIQYGGYFRAYGNIQFRNEFYSVKKMALKDGFFNGWNGLNFFQYNVFAGQTYTFLWNTNYLRPWFLDWAQQGYFDPLVAGDMILVTKLIVNTGDGNFDPGTSSKSVKKVIYYDKVTGMRKIINQTANSTPYIMKRSGIGQSHWLEYKGGGVYENVIRLDTNKVAKDGEITNDTSSDKTVDLIRVF